MNGALYPIPEDPTTPSHTLPYHTTPSHYPYHNEHPPAYPAYFPTPPSSVGLCIQENFEEDVEMTDNPLNDEFEKKMVRELETKDLFVLLIIRLLYHGLSIGKNKDV